MTRTIRLARETDAANSLAIYAPFIQDSAVTFEVRQPSEGDFRERIRSTLASTPWLLSEDRGSITGFAYAGPHRSREAYRWSVECSVYIHAGHRGRGLGRALYTALFACLRLQGYVNVYAGITLPNEASVKLHEGMGFTPVGVYRSVGYKLGRWHDVGWWHLALSDHVPDPAPPRAPAELAAAPEWREALAQGERLLR